MGVFCKTSNYVANQSHSMTFRMYRVCNRLNTRLARLCDRFSIRFCIVLLNCQKNLFHISLVTPLFPRDGYSRGPVSLSFWKTEIGMSLENISVWLLNDFWVGSTVSRCIVRYGYLISRRLGRRGSSASSSTNGGVTLSDGDSSENLRRFVHWQSQCCGLTIAIPISFLFKGGSLGYNLILHFFQKMLHRPRTIRLSSSSAYQPSCTKPKRKRLGFLDRLFTLLSAEVYIQGFQNPLTVISFFAPFIPERISPCDVQRL